MRKPIISRSQSAQAGSPDSAARQRIWQSAANHFDLPIISRSQSVPVGSPDPAARQRIWQSAANHFDLPIIATTILTFLILLIAAPAHTQTASLAGQTICLDPGHGGSDPGAVYDDGTIHLEEKDINLDVAYGLKALLEGDGATVVMTRTDDSTKSNSDRYTFCNNAGATILVSVHTNSTSNPAVDGSLALYFHKDDKVLARAIYDVMYPYLRDTAPDPSNFTGFGLDRYASGVLLKSDMPATMLEPLFMSNPDEARLLVTPISDPNCDNCRRAQIAQAIYEGIVNYFQTQGGGGGDGGGGGGPPCGSPPCRKGR